VHAHRADGRPVLFAVHKRARGSAPGRAVVEPER